MITKEIDTRKQGPQENKNYWRVQKFGIRDRVRISKHELTFRKGYNPQFTQEVFEIVASASKKPPKYTINGEQETILGKFIKKS